LGQTALKDGGFASPAHPAKSSPGIVGIRVAGAAAGTLVLLLPSLTCGTLFAWHKLPLRSCLLGVAVFCNEVKGKSMLALARDLDVQYKTAFVLAHKLREAMAASMSGLRIGGE